jgi:hypothetical protein
MTYINKINSRIDKNIYNGFIITFLILITYFIFFNNISLFTVTEFLFNSDLGRIVLLVTLIAIASCNLFIGIILLFILIFLYEYQHTNISKYNKINNNNFDYNYETYSSRDKKNITIQDIINLENNISSKQSNNSMNFGNDFNVNNSSIIQIYPSFENEFNNNYANF